MRRFEIKVATAEEFATAIEWAAGEGWNPGLDDLAAFHAADPEGFLIGMLDGAPVSSISVVRYGKDYGFLGFYIVVPEHRGEGYGIQTWRAGLAHLAGRTVGLDGVVAQQDNYRKSGFVLAGRNVRYSGRCDSGAVRSGAHVRLITADDLVAVAAYDRAFFPDDRSRFIKQWSFAPVAHRNRFGYVAKFDDAIKGYGVVRACRNGFKIGPLFADDAATAEDLYGALCQDLPPGSDVSLDVPEANAAAVDLAQRVGLEPSFETARMYRGGLPDLPLARTFGITTFELG